MKKIALTLAFLMSICMFTGCGDDNSSDEKSSSSSQVQEANGESLKSEDNSGFERGKVENNVYTSNFANVKFTAPDGWEFANDEYIASMMNIGLEITENDNDFAKAMLEQTTIYDTVCTDPVTGKNIIIMYENIAKEVPNPEIFSADDYVDSVEKQLTAMANVVYTQKGDRENISINGEDYIKQAYNVKYDEMGLETEQVYYVRKVGNFMLGIIASSGSTSDDMSVYEKNFEN